MFKQGKKRRKREKSVIVYTKHYTFLQTVDKFLMCDVIGLLKESLSYFYLAKKKSYFKV